MLALTFMAPISAAKYVGVTGVKISGNELNGMLINYDDSVKKVILRAIILRSKDNAEMFTVLSTSILLAPREVKELSYKLSLPNLCKGEDYKLVVKFYSGGGDPIYDKILDLDENSLPLSPCKYDIYFNLSNPVHVVIPRHAGSTTLYIPSYGLRGESVNINELFDVKFSLISRADNPRHMKIEYILTTANGDINNGEVLKEESVKLDAREEKEFSEPLKIGRSGTYDIVVVLKDANTLERVGMQRVRIVVRGVSGRIVDVINSKDVYEKGEDIVLQIYLVGAADGYSEVRDVKLVVSIMKDGNTLKSKTLEIKELPPESYVTEVRMKAPEKLDKYTLKVDLYDANNNLLDSKIVEYHKLEPEKIIYPDGRIRDLSVPCFTDGVCEESEIGYGCLDCLTLKAQTKEEEKIPMHKKVLISIAAMAIFMILTLILLVKRRG